MNEGPMKEGAIIHRKRCHRALRGITHPPSFETTVGYWILATRITGLCPAPFRLPVMGNATLPHMKEGDEK